MELVVSTFLSLYTFSSARIEEPSSLKVGHPFRSVSALRRGARQRLGGTCRALSHPLSKGVPRGTSLAQSAQVILVRSSEDILFLDICKATLLAISSTLRVRIRSSRVLLALLAWRYWLTAAWVIPSLLATSTSERPYFSTSWLASSDRNIGKKIRPMISQRGRIVAHSIHGAAIVAKQYGI